MSAKIGQRIFLCLQEEDEECTSEDVLNQERLDEEQMIQEEEDNALNIKQEALQMEHLVCLATLDMSEEVVDL